MFQIDSDKLKEECAVFGVCLNTNEAAGVTYNGLLALQHRGQEGAGIAVVNKRSITCQKDVGLVSDVFSGEILKSMPKGGTAVGHARYGTTGKNCKENCSPFVMEYLTGRIAVAHNGNVYNASDIRHELIEKGLVFNSSSDSEIISSLIAYNINKEKSALWGITKATETFKGAFSLLIATSKNKLIAVRDPNGFRPLCIGKNETGYAISSESCALEVCGFEFVRDVEPGEIIVIKNGEITFEGIALKNKEKDRGLCIFEYVYFARPDSVIDGLSVYNARFAMGEILAQEHPVEADVVCGVPDSGLEAARGYAAKSGIPLVTGFIKNRYLGRSFIYPTQSQRENIVRQKLNPLAANVKGKRVILVDDSIVRGTTCEKIVRLLRRAGAKEVHLRISAPPFVNTCHYGTDIDDVEQLIANNMTVEQIREKINTDTLGFISLDGLKKACTGCNLPFCSACFTRPTESTKDKKTVSKDVLEEKV